MTNLSDGVGPTVAFTVAATGTEPITYAWLFNGIAIAANTGVGLAAVLAAAPTTVTMTNAYGVNTATLTISNVTMANAGKYLRAREQRGRSGHQRAGHADREWFRGRPDDLAKPVLTVLAPSSKVMTIGSNDVNFAVRPGTQRWPPSRCPYAEVLSRLRPEQLDRACALGGYQHHSRARGRRLRQCGDRHTRANLLADLPLAGVYNGLF